MTGIPFAPPSLDQPTDSWAGGQAGAADIFGAAIDQAQFVDASNQSFSALEQAYDNRIQAVKAATGVTLPYPLAAPSIIPQYDPGAAARVAAFQSRLQALADEYPDPEIREAIGASRPISADAEALARESDSRLADLMASNPNWTSTVAEFAGSMVGGLRDPLQLGALFVGGPELGAAKTIGGRILASAARDAALNAAVSAAAQPSVQAWRQKIGLSSGFGEGFANVASAAAIGAAFGAGGRAIAEALGHFAGRAAAAAPDVAPEFKAALAGDADAGAAVLAPIRDTLPAEARGAIDAVSDFVPPTEEQLGVIRQQREQLLQARAAQAAYTGRVPELVLLDDEPQVARVTDRMAPAPDTLRNYEPPVIDEAAQDRLIAEMRGNGPALEPFAGRPTAAFVRDLGGVDPSSPLADELRSRGITPRTLPGLFNRRGIRIATAQGLIERRPRRALDNIPIDELPDSIRERAVDDGNGYATQQSLIDAMDEEQGTQSRLHNPVDAERDYYERQGVDFAAPDDEIKSRLNQIGEARARFDAAQAEIDAEPVNLTQGTASLPPRLTQRLMAENAVRAVQRALDGNFSDDVVHAAADLVLHEHEPVPDAVAFALELHAGIKREADAPAAAIDALGTDPPAPREDVAPEGEAAPALPDEAWEGIEKFPSDIGLVSAAAAQEELEQTERLETVVEFCHGVG